MNGTELMNDDEKIKTVLNLKLDGKRIQPSRMKSMSLDELRNIISIHPKKLLIVPVEVESIGMIKEYSRGTDLLGVPMNTFLDFDKIVKPDCKFFDMKLADEGYPNKMAYIEFLK